MGQTIWVRPESMWETFIFRSLLESSTCWARLWVQAISFLLRTSRYKGGLAIEALRARDGSRAGFPASEMGSQRQEPVHSVMGQRARPPVPGCRAQQAGQAPAPGTENKVKSKKEEYLSWNLIFNSSQNRIEIVLVGKVRTSFRLHSVYFTD